MIQYDNEIVLEAAQLVSSATDDVARRSLPGMSGHPRMSRYFNNRTDVTVFVRFCPKAKGINVAAGQYTTAISPASGIQIPPDEWAGEIQIAAPGATTGALSISIARDVP